MNAKNLGVCLIRCDAAPSIGFGHVIRCLALADELRDRHSMKVEFAMINGKLGIEQVVSKGYIVHRPDKSNLSQDDEGDWLQATVIKTQPRIVVLDVRTAFEPQVVQAIRAKGVYTATIDDPSERRLEVDAAFYPPVPQVGKLAWSAFDGHLHVGWEWVPLKPEFASARGRRLARVKDQSGPPRILVTMGGSDPGGLTLLALEALDQLDEDFNVDVILGGGFMHENALQTWMKDAERDYRISRNVPDLSDLMVKADLAVISFGVTAYEIATVGVPSIHLCLTEDHAESSISFGEAGMAITLGHYISISAERIAYSIRALLASPAQSARMSEQARDRMDGLGAARVADEVIRHASGLHK